MSAVRYWLVQEGPEIPQCPGVYGDSVLSHKQPPMCNGCGIAPITLI